MIKKLRIKIIATSLAAIFILLAGIIAIINIINFTMVANDADVILEMIEIGKGQFGTPLRPPEERQDNKDQLGPNSPEIEFSTRYFTYAFNDKGEVKQIAYRMSAYSEEEAQEWAVKLKNGNSRQGWTKSSYRYKVYNIGNDTYVTVIDQGRELGPSYRVLWISLIWICLGLIIAFIVLLVLSKKFVRPIEESNKKQENFVTEASNELKNPLTVIALENAQLSESKENYESTSAIDKQLKKLFALTVALDKLSTTKKNKYKEKSINLSELISKEIDAYSKKFEENNILVNKQINENVYCFGDEDMLQEMLYEIFENVYYFAKSKFTASLSDNNSRISIVFENDADNLPTGDLDRIFERFYKGSESNGKGLGLSVVKEIVSIHNGKVMAQSKEGIFSLKIEL